VARPALIDLSARCKSWVSTDLGRDARGVKRHHRAEQPAQRVGRAWLLGSRRTFDVVPLLQAHALGIQSGGPQR